MEIKKVKFSKWEKWNNRNNIENIGNPWIYILAIFENRKPEWNIDKTDENIIYIGETCNQTLKIRLNQFNKSAFEWKDGHSWWWSYNDKYNLNLDDDWEKLYISVFPISKEELDLTKVKNDYDKDYILSSFIRYVERKLILDFILKYNGVKNLLNKK